MSKSLLHSDTGLALNRREFFETAGAGLLIAASAPVVEAQRDAGATPLEARLHVGEDGLLTVFSGKIEEGQGAMTELALAAAEELRVPAERVHVVMADTERTPNDGTTAGSGTTPRTVPLVRKAAAAARTLLVAAAGREFDADVARLEVRDGVVTYGGKAYGYAELARAPELAAAYPKTPPEGVEITPSKDWLVLGKAQVRVDAQRSGHRRSPFSQRHCAAGDALRPGAAAALLRRHAGGSRPRAGAGGAGREDDARRRVRGLRRAHHLRRPQSFGGDLGHGQMEDRRHSLRATSSSSTCSSMPARSGARRRRAEVRWNRLWRRRASG